MSAELGINPYSTIYSPVRRFEVKMKGEKPFVVEGCRVMRNFKEGTTSLELGLSSYVFEASTEDLLYIRSLDGEG